MKLINLPIEVSFEEDVYIARCNQIQGAFAEGETPEEAIKELVEVVKMIFEYKSELQNIFDIETNKYFTNLPLSINA